MSLSFYTVLTGLHAFTEQLSVISDNLSNSETTAYKSNGISFAEVLNNAMSTNVTDSVGNGVTVQDTTASWTQGSLSSTGNSNNLAITGRGFFVVTDASGTTYYTRDGEFQYDSNENLVTATGLYVQGYKINDDGSLGSLSDINLSSSESIQATASSEITASINLNSASATGDTYSATINTYDSLGNEVPVTIAFTKSASNTWTWTASIDSATGTASGSGTLTFDSSGALESGTNPTITLTLSNGATTPQTITWNLYGSSGSTNGDVTQNASSSSLSSQSTDGTTSGSLNSISVDKNGVITGTYSNGETKKLFEVALADFSNYEGLKKTGNSLYVESSTSGTATLGVAGSNQFGTLTSGSLETSNVDTATEMANMIVAQRAYEACARMFTVESEILQTTTNMGK
jgi:flagellar hook protein FlgE